MKYFIQCPNESPELKERDGEPIDINGFHFAITKEPMEGNKYVVTELITGTAFVSCNTKKEAYGELLMKVNEKGELAILKNIVRIVSGWGVANKIGEATK